MKRMAAFLLAGLFLGGVFAGCVFQPEPSSSEDGNVLVEERGVTVTYAGMEMTEEGGLELTLTVENQGDKPLLLNVQEFSANRCSMAAFFASETAPGETAQDILTASAGELERYGLDTVEEASFFLVVFHGDTLEPILTTEQLHVDW